MSGREFLDAAYRATLYTVPGLGLKLFIGRPSRSLDAVLRYFDRAQWAFVTAANPRSKRLDERANAVRHHALRQRVWAGGWQGFEGYSVALDGRWPPESALLVLGIDEAAAVRLGRSFDQNAIVVGRRGAPPALRWCDEPE